NFLTNTSVVFIPDLCASSLATISHAPVSIKSSLLGNFAIQSALDKSFTLAFGLAPPNDEPGAINKFIHFNKSGLSCSKFLSNSRLARSNSLIDVHGGAE